MMRFLKIEAQFEDDMYMYINTDCIADIYVTGCPSEEEKVYYQILATLKKNHPEWERFGDSVVGDGVAFIDEFDTKEEAVKRMDELIKEINGTR